VELLNGLLRGAYVGVEDVCGLPALLRLMDHAQLQDLAGLAEVLSELFLCDLQRDVVDEDVVVEGPLHVLRDRGQTLFVK
jgi:hypothetical protein